MLYIRLWIFTFLFQNIFYQYRRANLLKRHQSYCMYVNRASTIRSHISVLLFDRQMKCFTKDSNSRILCTGPPCILLFVGRFMDIEPIHSTRKTRYHILQVEIACLVKNKQLHKCLGTGPILKQGSFRASQRGKTYTQ